MSKLPNIVAHHKGIVEEHKSFLTLTKHKIQLEYPDGSMSDEFIHDVVHRNKQDVVVIVPYTISYKFSFLGSKREIKIWLRSCVRPAISTREPFPNSKGNGWELPAGIIDQGETPKQAAERELLEEVGFNDHTLIELGSPVWSSPGVGPELLYFFAVNVNGSHRHNPPEDGSALEKHGICALTPLEDVLKSDDAKTALGAYRLVDWL